MSQTWWKDWMFSILVGLFGVFHPHGWFFIECNSQFIKAKLLMLTRDHRLLKSKGIKPVMRRLWTVYHGLTASSHHLHPYSPLWQTKSLLVPTFCYADFLALTKVSTNRLKGCQWRKGKATPEAQKSRHGQTFLHRQKSELQKRFSLLTVVILMHWKTFCSLCDFLPHWSSIMAWLPPNTFILIHQVEEPKDKSQKFAPEDRKVTGCRLFHSYGAKKSVSRLTLSGQLDTIVPGWIFFFGIWVSQYLTEDFLNGKKNFQQCILGKILPLSLRGPEVMV